MSKVEVDQVTQQSGTTLTVGGGACKTAVVDATTVTLGRCGGTVSLASGATQSGFGRTGAVNWQTGDIKTATFTAVSGNGYFCNTTAGVFNITLPASPSAGDIVGLKDYAETFSTYNLTIDRNGSKLNSNAGNKVLSTNNTSLTMVYVDGTQGWVPIEEGTGYIGLVKTYIVASGGTPCSGAICGNYKYHKFTGPGTFCVSSVGNPAGSTTVSYVVIGGGGGTGSRWHSGGAGAGGYREAKATCDTYTSGPLAVAGGLPVSASPGAYPIVIGGGGSVGTAPGNNPGTDGAISSFSTITAAKGGLGGTFNQAGNPGGSGGGGGSAPGSPMAGGTGDTPPAPIAQGQNGGAGEYPSGGGAGGGGGGATVAGVGGVTNCGGPGGNGATSSITGAPTGRAGGGAGGSTCAPKVGTATGYGNFPGASAPGSSGTANTGAGGSAGFGTSANGGAGGSGIVIIRYKFQ